MGFVVFILAFLFFFILYLYIARGIALKALTLWILDNTDMVPTAEDTRKYIKMALTFRR